MAGNSEIQKKFLKAKKDGGGLNEKGQALKDFFENSTSVNFEKYKKRLTEYSESDDDEPIENIKPQDTTLGGNPRLKILRL